MNFRKLLVASVIAGTLPICSQAMAEKLTPGQWDFGGIQQICLVSDGSWYGTTFSAWGGRWLYDDSTTVLYGNYASGVGNDNMAVIGGKPLGKTDWTEWRDDLSFQNFLDDVVVTFVKKACDGPPALPNSMNTQLLPTNPMKR